MMIQVFNEIHIYFSFISSSKPAFKSIKCPLHTANYSELISVASSLVCQCPTLKSCLIEIRRLIKNSRPYNC